MGSKIMTNRIFDDMESVLYGSLKASDTPFIVSKGLAPINDENNPIKHAGLVLFKSDLSIYDMPKSFANFPNLHIYFTSDIVADIGYYMVHEYNRSNIPILITKVKNGDDAVYVACLMPNSNSDAKLTIYGCGYTAPEATSSLFKHIDEIESLTKEYTTAHVKEFLDNEGADIVDVISDRVIEKLKESGLINSNISIN